MYNGYYTSSISHFTAAIIVHCAVVFGFAIIMSIKWMSFHPWLYMYVHRLACIKISDIRFDYIWTEFAEVLSPKLSTVHIHQNFTLKIFTTKDFTMQYSSTNWNSVECFTDICKYRIDVIWYSSNVMLHSLTIFPCVKWLLNTVMSGLSGKLRKHSTQYSSVI